MITTLVFAALGAVAPASVVGPVLDPIAGESVDATDRALLPAARHLGDVADMWFVALTNMQTTSGGLELFDPMAISAHGLSWTHVHTRLGVLDITDPARAGQPLVHVPYDAWDTLTWKTLWTDQPGFTYGLRWPDATQKRTHDVQVKLRYGKEVGGGAWIPRHVFDRDPAFSEGAPHARRALRGAYEAVLVANTHIPTGPVRIVLEGLAHTHTYLTLAPNEGAQRLSVLLAHHMPNVAAGADVTLVWQGQQRDYEGAQFRWPEDWTMQTRGQGLVGQATLRLPWSTDASLLLAVGAGWREDTERPRSQAGHVFDIADAWTWMARPHLAEDVQRFRVDAQAAWLWGEALELRFTGNASGIATTPRFGDGRIGEMYQRAPVRQTLWEGDSTQWWWQSWRAESIFRPDWRFAQLEGMLAVDVAAVQGTQAVSINSWVPALGLSARRALGEDAGGGEIFALARREPVTLDGMLMRFLNTGSIRGTTYAWQGPAGTDGVSAGALGSLLAPHGGETHALGDGVLRPTSSQVALGYRTPTFGPFQFVVQGVGRWLALRHTVRLSDSSGYQAQPFSDPMGSRELSQVYAQDPASFGAQTYVLVNDDKMAFFTGTEFQLYSLPGRRWFVNLGGAAYIAAGRAPFGSFFDRNDSGVIDESSASPNAQQNAFGRYDQDRSFTLKWLAGVQPLHNLSIALAARYRDGEPFNRVVVAEGLPQGAEVLMAQRRGRVRHTFAMTWDVRVRYDIELTPYVVTLGLDVYNFWGSATELLEDPRTSAAYRTPLETVPDRAILVSLEVGWAG